MKDIEKMTKDELKEYIKELENNKEEEQEKKEGLDIEDAEEKLSKLLDGANCIICCTDKGIYDVGTPSDMMNLLTLTVQNLKEEMPKDLIKFAVDNGLCDDKYDAIRHLMEAIKDKIGE